VETARKLKVKDRPGYISSDITQKNMPSGHGRRRTVVVEWFEFDHDPTTEEVRACCEELGYGYPTYEDGLRFQEDHPDDRYGRPHVVIPENPWCCALGSPQALHFWNPTWSPTARRQLDLRHCRLGDRWLRSFVFARRKYL
jgi:hypothetical protein